MEIDFTLLSQLNLLLINSKDVNKKLMEQRPGKHGELGTEGLKSSISIETTSVFLIYASC